MKALVIPWANMDRIAYAYLYFESVPAFKELWKHGLNLIGVIKTAMRQFTMSYLSNI